MYRPRQRSIKRLPQLERLPTIDDVMSAMQQARSSKGITYELDWTMADGLTAYRLLVTVAVDSSDPQWELIVGEGRSEVEAWSYKTGDVALVLNLVLSEATENVSDASTNLLGGAGDVNERNAGSYSTSLMGLGSLTTTSNKLPVFQPTHAQKAPTMEGTLKDMPVPTLLQSIAMGEMTGKLVITNEQTGSELFFTNGALIHATVLNLKGDLAIMELVTWDDGRFLFYRDEKTDQKTVERRVDALLMESITLLDQSKFLLKSGLKMETYLNKKYPEMSEAEFEQKIKAGAPCDINLQKQFYLRLDGNSTMFDILRERPMVKKEWVPILFNMLQCDLVALSDKPLVKDKASLLSSTALDRNAIDSVVKGLKRPDTGIISYPAFQYFLEQEFFRFQFYGAPFSVIIFDLWLQGQDKLEALPMQAIAEATRRIGGVKRSIDVLAHFEALNYALLLPNTETASAAILAHRMLEVVHANSLVAGMDPRRVALSFGIAGVPGDCREVGLLLSAAKVAKNVAQKSEFPIIMFKDLQAPPE
jgi:FOG: GGDEF domain